MNGEILSIETVNKIARLEKENEKLSNMVCDFDKEVNRLFNIIKDANNYLLHFFPLTEERVISLNTILYKGLNNKSGVPDAKTIS